MNTFFISFFFIFSEISPIYESYREICNIFQILNIFRHFFSSTTIQFRAECQDFVLTVLPKICTAMYRIEKTNFCLGEKGPPDPRTCIPFSHAFQCKFSRKLEFILISLSAHHIPGNASCTCLYYVHMEPDTNTCNVSSPQYSRRKIQSGFSRIQIQDEKSERNIEFRQKLLRCGSLAHQYIPRRSYQRHDPLISCAFFLLSFIPLRSHLPKVQ